MKNGPYTMVIAPSGYPGKLYRGRYCYEHHLVWWLKHKEVQNYDWCVHHKNGNKRDNRIENLEKISRAEHGHRHARGKAMVTLKCVFCGKEFEREKRKTYNSKQFFCGRSCMGKRMIQVRFPVS